MIKKVKIKKIQKLGSFDGEKVYDISMKGNNQYFFANNLLVHNTDSCYFSASDVLKKMAAEDEDFEFDFTKESFIQLYDSIGDATNQSFPDFMKKFFNCPKEYGSIIRAGRELVGLRGLFIKKKHYAIMLYDLDGERLDVGGKPGKIKAMGLSTKRTDTPKKIQKFLTEILDKLLIGTEEDEILDYIREFRSEFKEWPEWEKGAPKGVSGLDKYIQLMKNAKAKVNLPGHVRASINWNTLKDMNGDHHSTYIHDGMKILVFKLRHNNLGFTSISCPVDLVRVPEWFKQLPFDPSGAEDALIDKKLQNLIGVLGWDLESTKSINTINDLFDFG